MRTGQRERGGERERQIDGERERERERERLGFGVWAPGFGRARWRLPSVATCLFRRSASEFMVERITRIIFKLIVVPFGTVFDLRSTNSQKCEEVPTGLVFTAHRRVYH